MVSDCDKLRESSVYIKRWITRQPAVKEESITDWLLYDISEKISGITYLAFTRQEEARKTGADWEWWFLFSAFSAKMRIQAKKINPTKDNYPVIAHTNQYGLQIEKLLEESRNRNFVPFYAFYTSLEETVRCGRGINDEGVFLAGGNLLYADFIQGGKRSILPSDILEQAIPLSCFVCCPLCARNLDGFIDFLFQYFPQEIGGRRPGEGGPIPGIYQHPPNYISSFIGSSKDGLPDWWEREFGGELEGVNALVVYDARSQ